jgi:hypothetical protein
LCAVSGASTIPWSTPERSFASPPFPTGTPHAAVARGRGQHGRSTGERRPSAPCTAVSVSRARDVRCPHDVRTRAVARRPVRGLCFEFCHDPRRFRCMRVSAHAALCCALLAVAVLAIEVARRAIAPMNECAASVFWLIFFAPAARKARTALSMRDHRVRKVGVRSCGRQKIVDFPS